MKKIGLLAAIASMFSQSASTMAAQPFSRSKRRGAGISFNYHRDRKNNGTMSRRIARNYVLGRFKYC